MIFKQMVVKLIQMKITKRLHSIRLKGPLVSATLAKHSVIINLAYSQSNEGKVQND